MGHDATHAALHDHFNARRFTSIEPHLGTGFMFEDLGRGITVKTPAEFTDYLAGWTAGFSDATIGSPTYHAGADFSVATFHARGTNDGPLDAGVPATGRTMDVPFCEVLHYGSDGKVTNAELYYDQMSILTQLGIVSPPGSEPAVSPEATVREMLADMDRGDFDALKARMTEDVQGIDEISRGWLRGTEGMSAYFDKLAGAVSDISSTILGAETRITGDIALVTCQLEQDYSVEGRRAHVSAPTTVLLRRDGDAWKVALVHSVPLPAEE